MPKTRLVNLRRAQTECTRRIDRRTQFGNPFQLEKDGGEHTREESIRQYRLWFAHRIGTDPAFRAAVEELRGEVLGCWCKPKACHGDVILEYLEKHASARES